MSYSKAGIMREKIEALSIIPPAKPREISLIKEEVLFFETKKMKDAPKQVERKIRLRPTTALIKGVIHHYYTIS